MIEEEHGDHLGHGTWRGGGDPVRGIRNTKFGYRCSKTGPNGEKSILYLLWFLGGDEG